MTETAGALPREISRVIARAIAHLAVLILGSMLAFAAVFFYWTGRGTSFYYDEWNFLLDRRGSSARAFLANHNGHLVVIPVLIYKALWSTVGLSHYGPYRLVLLALHLLCVALLFLFVRRRAGGWLALAASTSMLFLGAAWMDIYWPFQIGYLGSLASGLGALLLLDRRDLRGDLGTAALLGASLACSGLGIAFVAGTAVSLLLERRSWRRLWLIVAPAIPYGAWYLHYGQNEAMASNLRKVPWYLLDSFAGALGAITSLGTQNGEILATAALGAIALTIYKRRIWLQATSLIVIALAFWGLTALSRAQLHEPDASRYLYPGALIVFLVVAELARGVRVWPPVVAVLCVAVAIVSVHNLSTLRNNVHDLGRLDHAVAVDLGAIEAEKTTVSPNFAPDPAYAPQITAGRYLAAVSAGNGSPAIPLSVTAGDALPYRERVDVVLAGSIMRALVSRGSAPHGASAPRLLGLRNATRRRSRGCLRITPRSARKSSEIDLLVPDRGLSIRSSSSVAIWLARFAPVYPYFPLKILRSGSTLLRPPADSVRKPWRMRLTSLSTTEICTIA